jgi:hypothetical protein
MLIAKLRDVLPHRAASLALIAILPATGCASRSDAGAALVAAGAVVAVAAAYAATERPHCGTEYNCQWSASTSKHGAAAAAGVATGVGLAAMGAAIAERDPAETKPKRNPPPLNPFRLVRPAEDPLNPTD